MDEKRIEDFAKKTCESYDLKMDGYEVSKDGKSIKTCGRFDSGDLHLDVVVFDKLD